MLKDSSSGKAVRSCGSLLAQLRRFKAATFSFAVLGALAGVVLSQPGPGVADPWHARVRLAAEELPHVVGDWVGRDIEPLAGAVKLLKPNVIMHRRYVNSEGRVADLLLVQCRDARDMVGHYPPICYRAHGWEAVAEGSAQWGIAGRTVTGMEYEYARNDAMGVVSRVVANLVILPEGRFATDMKPVQDAATSARRRHFGAAQIQIVLDASVPPDARRAAIVALLEGAAPVLDVLCSGELP